MNIKVADRIKLVATLTASGILLFVLYVSRDHITEIGHWLHLPNYQAQTLFILVDLPALVGRLLMLPCFASGTRAWGKKLSYISGGLSLGCNVGAGIIIGEMGVAGYGAFVVAIFLLMEHTVSKIKPAASVTKAKRAAKGIAAPAKPVLTPRQVAARKGAATRARNAAAPVSPGVGPVGEYAGRKA